MECWILFSLTLLGWLLAAYGFRKTNYIENAKISFSTPEPAKYNDVFKVDGIDPSSSAEEQEEDAPKRSVARAQLVKDDDASTLLKRIVAAEAKILNAAFQINGVLYSAENFGAGETKTAAKTSHNSRRDYYYHHHNRLAESHLACPECTHSIGSMRKDISHLEGELAALSQQIHSAMREKNCTKREFLRADYQWHLDGKCGASDTTSSSSNNNNNNNNDDDDACSLSCSNLLHEPSSKKTPTGRSSRRLALMPGPLGTCAVKLGGGDSIDLGEWVGSCVAQPERCPAGLSLIVWLWLDIPPSGTVMTILTAGDSSPAGRGFALMASSDDDDDDALRVTARLRDATNVWNAEGLVIGGSHRRQWMHLALTWNKKRGLELFIDGQMITRQRSVIHEVSRQSPMTRLTIGEPPGVLCSPPNISGGTLALSNLSLYVSRLDRKDIANIYYQESELNSIGN